MLDNLWLWVLFLVLDMGLTVAVFKFFGKKGLYAVIAMNIIIANIQVTKTVEILGWVMTLGNVLYGSIFFCTDILNEIYGKKEAQRAVWLGFFVLVISTLYMQIALWFLPHSSDFAHPFLEGIFSLMPRIVAGSLIAYIISQTHDVWAFNFWKKRLKGKFLWFRNNASTMISQGLDSVIFCVIAFWGLWSFEIWVSVLITTYVMKFLVAVADTPFLYIAKIIHRKKEQSYS